MLLNTLGNWFEQHGMKVNAAKTEFIVCGDRRQLKNIDQPQLFSFIDEKIQSSEKVRNLGVFMDQTLSWDHHIKTITNRCFGILIALHYGTDGLQNAHLIEKQRLHFCSCKDGF